MTMFKCTSIAHWNAIKGRMRLKTSNRHMYIKKKGGLPDAALRKGKAHKSKLGLKEKFRMALE